MKNLFLLIILLGTIFTAYWYGYPAFTGVMEDRSKIAEVNMVRDKINAIKDEHDKLIERLNSIDASQIARLEMLLPRILNEEELYVFFQNFIQKYSVIPKSVVVTKSASASEGASAAFVRSSLGFDIKVEGSYENIRLFLEGIENNLRLMDVSSVGIDKNEKGIYTLSLQGNLYYGN